MCVHTNTIFSRLSQQLFLRGKRQNKIDPVSCEQSKAGKTVQAIPVCPAFANAKKKFKVMQKIHKSLCHPGYIISKNASILTRSCSVSDSE